jgi:DNA polymerase III epsilon subunit-like protein
MTGIQFIILDSETTGFDSKVHEVNEVSLIRYDSKVQLTEFIKCDYPEKASYDALKATNKTIEDLLKGKTRKEVLLKMNDFLNSDGLTSAHRCFVAHNAKFDKRFIHALYDKENIRCPVDLWLCTMNMTKAYIKKMGQKSKANLQAACEFVGVKRINGAHASQVDTRNTYFLFKNLIEDKQMDYLPFIETFPHHASTEDCEAIEC